MEETSSPWIWKDGKGGFQKYLETHSEDFYVKDSTMPLCNDLQVVPYRMIKEWNKAYRGSDWFHNNYLFLVDESVDPPDDALDFELKNGFLYKKDEKTGLNLLWIPEGKVRQLLMQTHDKKGHWGPKATVMRLVRRTWWSRLSDDIKKLS